LTEHCSVDVLEFEAAVARGEWDEAARLYQDDLLPDLYDEWIAAKRDQLRLQFMEALEKLTTNLEAAGDWAAAISNASRLLSLDGLREPSYQMLIRLHLKNGDRPSALRTYHQCMRMLRRELGISPSQGTEDLYEEALKTEHVEAPPIAPALDEMPVAKPMVGRRNEWDRLLACWSNAKAGNALFALISGEPGIGKSHLAEEMFRYCVQNLSVAGASARCYSAKGHLAYGPIAEWLKADSLKQARNNLPKPQLGELSRVLPELLIEDPSLPAPDPLTESWQRRHFFEAINAPFSKCKKPLLLFIDDLQWCDQESIEWLHSFLRSEASAQTLMLGTVRPEETDRDHPLTIFANELRAANLLTDIALAPLSTEESAALAAQIGQEACDSTFLNELYRTTKGNPLFVVESMRAALEDQSGAAVPPRIQSVIAGRLGNLSPSAYELAGLAASIGRPFSSDLLAKATDWDEDSLLRSLEELWRRRIIENRGEEKLDFTHDLVREVAYAELSPFRRRSWHKRVAQALQDLHGSELETVSGWIAAHYESAGMMPEAIGFYRIAASAARQLYADAEAAELMKHALQLCKDLPQKANREAEELELLTSLGLALVTTLGYSHPEVGQTLENALVLSRRAPDRKHLFTLQTGVWLHEIVRGQIERSREVSDECIQVALQDQDIEQEMAGRFILGSSLFHLGRFADSLDHLERSLSCRVRSSDPAVTLFAGPDLGVFCWAYYPHVLWHLGRTEEAASCGGKAVELARELSHPFSLAIALNYAAMFSAFRHDRSRAYALADEASAVCRKHGFAYYLAFAEILAGWADSDGSRGLARLRQGLEDLRATGAELRLPFYYSLLAEACFEAGHEAEALAAIASGLAFQNKNGELWCEPGLRAVHDKIKDRSGTEQRR
jgi:tetratricopeptide (TPR) repeat protein